MGENQIEKRDIMQYGMPTLIELRGLEENMKFCKSLDLDFVELNMNVPEFQTEKLRLEKPKNLMEAYNLDLTMHLPENFYFADFNPHMRAAAYEVFKDAVDVAQENRFSLLNMHMHVGTFFTMPDDKVFLQGAYLDEYLKNVVQFRELVDQTLGQSELNICIENACDFHHGFIKKAVDVLLESDNIDLTWDTGHNAKGNYQDQIYLFNNHDRIKHVHLHDFAMGSDHLPLGSGEVCVESIMKKLTDKCESIVLESKSIEGVQKSIFHLEVLRNRA